MVRKDLVGKYHLSLSGVMVLYKIYQLSQEQEQETPPSQ